jgi:hypothetical protein
VQGIAVVSGYARPLSLENTLTPTLRVLWGSLLTLGGVAAVAGLYWPWDPVDGVLVKRVGLIGLALATLAYGIAALALGPIGFLQSAYAFSYAIACLVRAWQVTVALAAFREHVKDMNGGRRRRLRAGGDRS